METHKGYLEWCGWSIASFILFMAGRQLPILGPFMLLAASFPYLVIVRRCGKLKGLVSITAIVLSLLFIFPPLLGVYYAVNVGLLGLGLGILSVKEDSWSVYLMKALLLSLFIKALYVVLMELVTQGAFLTTLEAFLREWLSSDSLKSLFPSGGKEHEQAITQFIADMKLRLPGNMVMFSIVEVFYVSQLAAFVLKKLGVTSTFNVPRFGEWRLPKNILLALLVAFLCIFLGGSYSRYPLLEQVGVNLELLVTTLFYVQGASVAWYYAENRSIPRILRVLFIALTLVHTIPFQILSLVGVFDVGFDLRARMRRKES